MKHCQLLLAAVLFINILLGSSAYAAAVNLYQVELIIFSHPTTQALSSEQWPFIKATNINYSNATSLKPVTDYNGSNYFTLLPQQYFKLKQEQKNLDKYANYHTLLHLAWIQPIYEPRYARAVHIQSNNVNGTITLSVRRFIDLKLDLVFGMPINQLENLTNYNLPPSKNGLIHFRLSQSRRMRDDELNYIDFPLYGVLIKVIPVSDSHA